MQAKYLNSIAGGFETAAGVALARANHTPEGYGARIAFASQALEARLNALDEDADLTALQAQVDAKANANSATILGFLTRGAIKDTAPVEGTRVYLTEAHRSGSWVYRAGNYAAKVTLDTFEGRYFAPDSDPSGATGAWVREWEGQARPEWFGAVPSDTEALASDCTDAINACLAVCGTCYLRAWKWYGAASAVLVNAQGKALKADGIGQAYIVALAGFDTADGSGVVVGSATRITIEGIYAKVPTTVYDPATQTGISISGFLTNGSGFHKHIIACTGEGGKAGFELTGTGGETKLHRTHAILNYDGYYINEWDTSFQNISATSNVRYGCYVESRGLQGTDIHLVYSGDTALYFNNCSPCQLDIVHIDTPTYDGITFVITRGAVLNSVYFTKMGQNRVGTGRNCNYLTFANSARNVIRCGAIHLEDPGNPIDRTGHYFLKFGDTVGRDDRASVRNLIENADTSPITDVTTNPDTLTDITIVSNAGQRLVAQAQKFINCHGSLSKYNNEGLLWRSDLISLTSGATTTLNNIPKVWLPQINTANGNRMSVLSGEWDARGATAGDWAFGTFHIRLGSATNSVKIVVTDSAGTAPTFTIGNIAINTSTRVLTFEVTNSGGATFTMAMSLRAPLDNTGLA